MSQAKYYEEVYKKMEENLKKYYKNVFICKKCNRQFGSDFRNDEASLCPICLQQLHGYKLQKGKNED